MEVTKSLVIHADASLSLSALSLTLDSPHKEIAITKDINLRLMKYLGSVIPWNRDRHSSILPSASRTSAALGVILPANEPGQHDIPSANLSIPRAGIRDIMGLASYLISNNLSSGDGHFGPTERDDKLYLQILKDIGWDNLSHLKILLSSREPTVEAIAERLFAAAVRSYNPDIIEKMLRAGMNPNMLFKEWPEGWYEQSFFTPLQYLANIESPEILSLLISHGADVNFSVNDDGLNALFYALGDQNWTVIRFLLDNGATVTRQCAERLTDFRCGTDEGSNLVEDMIGIHLDISVATQQDETRTVLSAIPRDNVDMVQRFVAKGARLNGLLRCDSKGQVHQTTLLGLAVRGKAYNIIRLLVHVRQLVHVAPRENLSLVRPPYVSPCLLYTSDAADEMD